MFPHTITIFNVIDDKYYRKEVSDVFAITERIISKEGKGEKFVSAHRVIFSNIAMNDYLEPQDYLKLSDKSNNYTLRENDIIVIGKFDDINDLSTIQKSSCEYFLIKTVSVNKYGDIELQNIEVTDWI